MTWAGSPARSLASAACRGCTTNWRARAFAVALALLIQLGCARDNVELRRELRMESAKSGLAVAEIGEQIAVVPFDGPQRYFVSKYRHSTAIIGKGGTMIAWYDFGGPLIFEKTTDTARTVEHPLTSGFWPLTLDERSDRLVFVTGGTAREAAITL